MAPTLPRSRAALATALVVAGIVHGSLWPYEFSAQLGPVGPVQTLLGSWTARPSGLGDILANVLLYAPFGLFAVLAAPGPMIVRLLLTLAGGAGLSVAIELMQFYDAGRVTSLWDVGTNTTGTAAGALAGLLFGRNWRTPLIREVASNPVPSILLAAMLGYRLVPYVPTIDLHKYWTALKPLLLDPLPEPGDVFRYVALWLTACELVAGVFGLRRSLLFAPLLVGFVLAGKVVIAGSVVTQAEVAGAGLAVLLAWPLLLWLPRVRTPLVALVLLASIMADRLQPFDFQPDARPFGWLPFRAFFGGSLVVNAASFCEKLFLYGTLLWLLPRAGLPRVLATLFVAAVLLGTSLAQTALPGRSAEITDAVMVLLIAGLFTVLEDRRPVAAASLPLHRGA